jgi:hypothetical protein
MKKATGSAFVWVAALSVAVLPLKAGAQSHSAAGAGELTDAGVLAPSEIIASVRSAGFDPRSRPLHRGGVYFVFAVDRHSIDVRVTVDASSGRVLSATRLAGTRYGGPGYDGHEVHSRIYERPPVPPADIPNPGVARNTGVAPSPPRAPLPRSRPGDVVSETAPEAPAQAAPRPAAPPSGPGDTTARASPSPPPSTATAEALPPVPPPPPSRSQQPTMVPIAPLE